MTPHDHLIPGEILPTTGTAAPGTQRLTVVGIGQTDHGDDAAGLLAAQAISEDTIETVTVKEIRGDVTHIIPVLAEADAVWIIDAVTGIHTPGDILRFDMHRDRVPAELRSRSTHGLSVVHAVELTRIAGRLPPTVIFYGIVGSDFHASTPPSRPVMEAVRRVKEAIRRDILETGPPDS